MRAGLVSLLAVLLLAAPLAAPASAVVSRSNATFSNDAKNPAADPFVLWDERSGSYYAYSTEGADPGYHFAIYRSPDLATWERLPGGALPAQGQWGHDWFWAPEVYHNAKTGKYFLFYAARMNKNVAENFTFGDFEEPCKLGVAVADSPAGPFHNIQSAPLDYFPYDPDYHDVNRIMDATQKKPPATHAEGRTAPRGTYIPMIDPNVFFDNGRIYLYFSRNAYRNWVWDEDLGKYIEESNIYAVRLDSAWWNDPSGRTMPRIDPGYVDANKRGDSGPRRRDGYTPILNYGSDKQSWENAHVDDYAKTDGEKKDRRWEEGSTTVKRMVHGKPVYYLTYSANNYESPSYGVGYATAPSPLGPWRKSAANPILSQNPSIGMYSTGHGSIIGSPDGRQEYYVHHARPSDTADRALYTDRMRLDPGGRLSIEARTGDTPLPSGVGPLRIGTDQAIAASGKRLSWRVRSAPGAVFPLGNPQNRVRTESFGPDPVRLDEAASDGARVSATGGVGGLRLSYQRRHAAGDYYTVRQNGKPLSTSVPVAACTQRISGTHPGPLTVRRGVTCVQNARIAGPVHVAPGASLVVVDSTVLGPVTANRAGAFWLTGSRVFGPVHAEAAGWTHTEDNRVLG
ncbi:glycoside hydrolase family 43 protein [Sciscionella sediminilitoris]|uniref:glycoside hydrolase family 43 protein n=1 Tax=Sciscionella sediminilitoris TaxID=1445613 RepID=UPI0004DF7052|nr:glycoside hydrolase family 43 protein [Sciscionella sp. SE31]